MARAATLVAVTMLAISAVGCGGSGDAEPSAEPTGDTNSSAEAWADDVCLSVSTWEDVVMKAGSTLREPRDLSVNSFKSTVGTVVDATGTLVQDLASLGPPDTEAGEDAQQQLTGLSDGLESEADVLRAAIDADVKTIEQLLSNVSTISGALSNMTADVEAAVNSIEALDGAEELSDAFTTAASCQQVEPAN